MRVTVPHGPGQEMLLGPVTDFLQKHRRVTVEWLFHDTKPEFLADQVDCAIQFGRPTNPSHVAIELGCLSRIVVAAPQLLTNYSSDDCRALSSAPWLMLKTQFRSSNAIVLNNRKSAGTCEIPISPRFITDSLFALRSAAINEMGLCVGSEWIFSQELEKGILANALPGWYASPLNIYIVYPYARHYSAKLRLFVASVRDGIRSTTLNTARQQ